ncbi:hypothetical protein Ahy_A06g029615 [Arachis hypogaea]|uniref:GRF-type domain-containing protein n=1 Tax=Arachis hypogaea TaxID=3818 RepID=A0A445CTX5_ARAHY|nr:hypothetical protein Ahy_A06g029615 [Arachis hypogaea]
MVLDMNKEMVALDMNKKEMMILDKSKKRMVLGMNREMVALDMGRKMMVLDMDKEVVVLGMNMDMSSFQSSGSSSKNRGRRRTCFCGERPSLQTSCTAENPGRRFWSCVNYQIGEGCDYFSWAEPEGQDPQIERLKNKASSLKQELQKAERKFVLALAVGILGWIMLGCCYMIDLIEV